MSPALIQLLRARYILADLKDIADIYAAHQPNLPNYDERLTANQLPLLTHRRLQLGRTQLLLVAS